MYAVYSSSFAIWSEAFVFSCRAAGRGGGGCIYEYTKKGKMMTLARKMPRAYGTNGGGGGGGRGKDKTRLIFAQPVFVF